MPSMDFKTYEMSFSKAERSSELLRSAQNDRLSKTFIDVVLVLDNGVEIPAHRLVLASASAYFRAMFTINMHESSKERIHLRDVDSASMEALVDFAYTGKISITSGNDVTLFCTADRLLFEDVVHYCCTGLAKHVNKANCLTWMTFAYEHNCEKLLSVARRLAAVHIVDLVKTDEFRRLSLEIVSQLLALDELAVSREEDVWDVVMQWIEYDEENRKSRFEELSKFVRFPLIVEREFLLSHPVVSVNESYRSLVLEKSSEPRPTRRLGNKVLLAVGGVVSTESKGFFPNDVTATKTVEYYDHLSNVWKEFPSLNEARYSPGVVTLDNSVYAIGGWRNRSVERYDSTEGCWMSDVSPMQFNRTGKGVVVYENRIYAMGSNRGENEFTLCEQYNSATNSWTSLQSLSKPVLVEGTLVSNDHIYVLGSNLIGLVGENLDVFKYDPFADCWLDVPFCSQGYDENDDEFVFQFLCADRNCLHLRREILSWPGTRPFEHLTLDVRNGQLTRYKVGDCPPFLDTLRRFYDNAYCLYNEKVYSVGGVMRGACHDASDVQTFFWYDMSTEVAQYVEGPRLMKKRSRCGVAAIDRRLTFNVC